MFLNKFRKKKIYTDGDSLVIEIPKKSTKIEGALSILCLIIGIVFLFFFSVFMPLIIDAILNDGPESFSMFIYFMGGWIIFLFILGPINFLTSFFFYTRTIILNKNNLEIKNKLFREKIKFRYDIDKIKNLYYSADSNLNMNRTTNLGDILKRNNGYITVLYENNFSFFGNNLNGTEAKEILLAMKDSGYLNPEIFKPYNILEN